MRDLQLGDKYITEENGAKIEYEVVEISVNEHGFKMIRTIGKVVS